MTDNPPNLNLDTEAKEEIYCAFIQIVKEITDHCKWDPDSVQISSNAFAIALGEAAKDLKAIQMRRRPKELSVGKIAGIITFRLVKGHPISLFGNLAENRHAIKINTLAAIVLSFKHFLGVTYTSFPEEITREFQYTLLRRHTNQETLGLSYDMLNFYALNCRIHDIKQPNN